MSRYLYKKIQNISPESLNFQHSGLKLTTLGSDPNVVTFLVASQANVAVDKKILGSDPIKNDVHKNKI